MPKPFILVTFDSMIDPNSGYFSFGKGLGEALIKENNKRFALEFYLFKNTPYRFKGGVDIRYRRKLDALFFTGYNNYDLVHLTDQRARLKPGWLKAKKVMTIHTVNKAPLKNGGRLQQTDVNNLRKKIAACDKVVAISNFVAAEVVRHIPEAKEKLSIIYSGAEKLYSPENYIPPYYPQRKFLFAIGLMSPQKGFHLIPPLLQGNDYQLVISGVETPHKLRILKAAEKYGCADRLIITGPISETDKAWYYKNCSALIFPSVAEGFGLPVIEVMHFGKPVFLAKRASLPEVGGNAAYYFDNFEPGHMQQIFKAGMQDYADNNRAENIMAHAAKFTWKKAAQQYMKLYEELTVDLD